MKLTNRFKQSVVLAMLSLVGFALTTGGIRLWVGAAASRQDDSLAVKLAHFEMNKDSYTSVFIGNSRMYRGINPALFDEAMTTAGRRSNSYNFGIPAMTAAEINKVVRHIAAVSPCCLDYVFVELWSPSHLVSVRADRTIASYDPITAWFATQHTIGSDRTLPDKAMMSAEIVAAAGLNTVNVGSLLHMLPEYVPAEPPLGEDSDTYNGYTSLEEETLSEIRHRRENFVAAGEAAFSQLVDAQRSTYGSRPELQSYQADALILLDDYVDRLSSDTELIFVVTPFGKSYDVNDFAWPVIDYNNVSAYPELFDMSLWFDEGHLTAEGAEWMTRDLADKVLEMNDDSIP